MVLVTCSGSPPEGKSYTVRSHTASQVRTCLPHHCQPWHASATSAFHAYKFFSSFFFLSLPFSPQRRPQGAPKQTEAIGHHVLGLYGWGLETMNHAHYAPYLRCCPLGGTPSADVIVEICTRRQDTRSLRVHQQERALQQGVRW